MYDVKDRVDGVCFYDFGLKRSYRLIPVIFPFFPTLAKNLGGTTRPVRAGGPTTLATEGCFSMRPAERTSHAALVAAITSGHK